MGFLANWVNCKKDKVTAFPKNGAHHKEALFMDHEGDLTSGASARLTPWQYVKSIKIIHDLLLNYAIRHVHRQNS